MKNTKIRLLALVLALVLVIPFAACDGKTPDASTPNQGQNQTPPENEVKYDLS